MEKEQFIEIFKRDIKRRGSDKLLEWLLATDFFTAPASTRFHGAYEGGLLEHSYDVYNRFDCESAETRAICAFLHDVCKANFYAISTRNVKTRKQDSGKSSHTTQLRTPFLSDTEKNQCIFLVALLSLLVRKRWL